MPDGVSPCGPHNETQVLLLVLAELETLNAALVTLNATVTSHTLLLETIRDNTNPA